MSLKATENVYNLVIDNVIKEITDDPQMNSISTEAIEYLGRTWRTKLHDTGVFTPPNTDFQKHIANQHHLQAIRPAMPDPYLQNMAASSTADQATLARIMGMNYPRPGNEYIPEWIPPQYQFPQGNRFPNIQYDAKPMLTSGPQPAYPQSLVHQHMMGQMQGNPQHMMNMNMGMNPAMQQPQKKEPAKNTINIKAEPNRDEDEQSNNSSLPTKVPVGNQGPIDISTPKRSATNTEATTPLPRENEKEPAKIAKPAVEEEEKKDNGDQSDADDEQDENNEAAEEEDEDDARLFEYEAGDKGDIPQPKEEHIPPPLQQGNAIAQAPVALSELDPYNPQDRPLDSDDDPGYEDAPETTDILIAFHEKVHRHGTKWKVTLKQGIMNAKGKEYILSQITGDFDFM